MLKTHTGRPIAHEYLRRVVTCGPWSVPIQDISEKRPGRARQMRRMVAKAKRRERREFRAWASARPHITVNEARAFHDLPPLPDYGFDAPIDDAGEFVPAANGLDNLMRRIKMRLETGAGGFLPLPSYGLPLLPPCTVSADISREGPPVVKGKGIDFGEPVAWVVPLNPQPESGTYVVSSVGAAGVPFVLTRDYSAPSVLPEGAKLPGTGDELAYRWCDLCQDTGVTLDTTMDGLTSERPYRCGFYGAKGGKP